MRQDRYRPWHVKAGRSLRKGVKDLAYVQLGPVTLVVYTVKRTRIAEIHLFNRWAWRTGERKPRGRIR